MRGRPREKYALHNLIGVRLNDMDAEKLDQLCEELDEDRCEVMRRALRYYYLANGLRRN